MNTVEIDTGAPAIANGEIEIAATPEMVWSVLTDIASWPRWNPDVKSASIDGPFASGTQFRWKAGPGTISSTLQGVEPHRRIEWIGTTFGIKAIHIHRLEGDDGTTIVKSAESWNGLPVRLLRRSMRKTLQKAIDSGLSHLKVEAERRAAEAQAS